MVKAIVAPSYAKPRSSGSTMSSLRSTSHWLRAPMPQSKPQITACGTASSCSVTADGSAGNPRFANVTSTKAGDITRSRRAPRMVVMLLLLRQFIGKDWGDPGTCQWRRRCNPGVGHGAVHLRGCRAPKGKTKGESLDPGPRSLAGLSVLPVHCDE